MTAVTDHQEHEQGPTGTDGAPEALGNGGPVNEAVGNGAPREDDDSPDARTSPAGAPPAGPDAIAWDGLDPSGNSVPSGVYYFQLKVDGKLETKQLVVLLR